MKDDRCIYVILSRVGSAYYKFVSTFYATKESLGSASKKSTLESFCDSPIREKYNLLKLGVINIVGASNKSLVA